MFRKLHTRISPASLLAMVALFVALGGVSYAAATIGSPQIKDNSIRSKDVRDSNLRGKDLRPDTITGIQVDESTLEKVPSAVSADNAQNAVNAQQAQNSVNAQTAAAVGPNGVGTAALQNGSVRAAKLGATVTRSQTVSVAATSSEFLSAGCLAGERMLSGGVSWTGASSTTAPDLHIVHSYPLSTTQWSARGYNGTAAARDLTVRVLCLAG
jgi:hypothetical protein